MDRIKGRIRYLDILIESRGCEEEKGAQDEKPRGRPHSLPGVSNLRGRSSSLGCAENNVAEPEPVESKMSQNQDDTIQ